MSSVLPFDIIALIIDIVGENEDANLLKELALVSHSFLQICSKHLFATVELHDAVRKQHIASSKKGFVKLLKSRPEAVNYIRKLTYKVSHHRSNDEDHLLSPILLNFLPTLSRLNCLTINASRRDWNTLDSSLISALLHLMHLPTLNHIDLSRIQNFPLSSLTPSVNLHRLDISNLRLFNQHDEDDSHENIVQLGMMPKLREFHTSNSSLLTTKLLHAKTQDGGPAFNIMDLRRLSISLIKFEDGRNVRYLLQNAKLLEKLHLSVDVDRYLVGLLSPSTITLKVLDLTVTFYDRPLVGLYEELEAMAGHNMLESLYFGVEVFGDEPEDDIGSIIQNVEKVLVKPGWPALRHVSFKVLIELCPASREERAKLSEAIQSLRDKYLSHLPKAESIAFNYSYYYIGVK